ncbi:hypothetical protein M422DRAFT_54934 [Sphaerobolus stellatus SS14]|uniref:Uncharacterized protein n=1 Tax=Sphaerobolus stellatus (strain SS14) TaxID=990650 RepID=A0A0C9UQM8_SPHS4|nr:hypothetical protein M422DRAFT_54934 [Sphaerobolus stellatus SS14]
MMRFDIILADDTGERLCTLSGVEVAKHILRASADTSQPFEVVLQPSSCNSSITVNLSFVPNGINEHLSCLDGHIAKDELPTNTEIHHEGITQVLRAALHRAVITGKRSIRVLLLLNDDSYPYLSNLLEVLEHETSLHLEIFTNTILPADSEGPRHMVRSVALQAITAGESDIKLNFFDIAVISSDPSSTSGDMDSVVEACKLLSHGGALILTSCRQDSMDFYSKLTKSCDIQVLQISSQNATKSLFIIEGSKKPCPCQADVDQSLWSFSDPLRVKCASRAGNLDYRNHRS